MSAMPGMGQRLGGEYRTPGESGDSSPNYGDGSSCADNPVILGGGLCIVLACVLGAVVSLGSVPPLHLGIQYNQFSKAAGMDRVYTPGRYFIGPFSAFILFPSDVQHIEFTNNARISPTGLRYAPLHTRTKEGLGLHLQVSLQYKLIPDQVMQLYSEFNKNYEQVFVSSVRDVLIKAASEYEASNLWEERDLFSSKMQKMVDHELRKTYAECWGLQLMIIDLPNGFETSIVETQVQKQLMLIREQQQISAQIRAETTVIKAEFERKVKIIMADGHANYTIVTKEAAATAEKNKIHAESEALHIVKQKLQMDPDGLIKYQQFGALDDLGEAALVSGFGEDHGIISSSFGGR